ncbi:p24 complex component [Mycoemilia scoparia]|uniref:P24 complex component n=1 Tax=Mycoemilia scoparia TaxID=417184 RepID=A0A9W7ZZ89_9FUNG|nr:p24 complex component [Mycoemilia scoparia]
MKASDAPRPPSPLATLLLVLSIICNILIPSVSGYSTTIQPQEEQCYGEKLDPNETLDISFDVIDNIKVTFTTWKLDTLQDTFIMSNADNVKVTCDAPGWYKYCFKNTFHASTIIINFRHRPEKESFRFKKLDNGVKQEKTKVDKALEAEINTLSTYIGDMITDFEFMVSRDISRFDSGALNKYLIYWSVVQSLALIGVFGWQVYYMTSLFKLRCIV